jgi:hypothetical protein
MAELGKLIFTIPEQGDNQYTTKILTFVQNITVSESKNANYASYDIVSRSSSIFAYLGAKARTIKLSFDIFLDHIKKFTGANDAADRGSMGAKVDFEFDVGDALGGAVAGAVSNALTASSELDYWTNTIRACVANESDDPTLGPPTVKFNYTSLYRDVLCIVKDYKIDIKATDEAGFMGNAEGDGTDLLPRLVSISLSLEEVK